MKWGTLRALFGSNDVMLQGTELTRACELVHVLEGVNPCLAKRVLDNAWERDLNRARETAVILVNPINA